MPKEQINYVDLDVPSSEKVTTDDSCVGASWLPRPDADAEEFGHVQVYLEVDVSYAAFAIETPNGARGNRTQLFTPVLTRRDVNKFIRVLKRARDAAYGADE